MSARLADPLDVQVGQRIRVRREEIGMSQTVLAERLGVTFQQVQKYERGTSRISAGRLTKAADTLGVAVSKLLGEYEDEAVTQKGPRGAQTQLGLLIVPGALRLLRAYAQIEDSKQRRTVVTLLERISRR